MSIKKQFQKERAHWRLQSSPMHSFNEPVPFLSDPFLPEPKVEHFSFPYPKQGVFVVKLTGWNGTSERVGHPQMDLSRPGYQATLTTPHSQSLSFGPFGEVATSVTHYIKKPWINLLRSVHGELRASWSAPLGPCPPSCHMSVTLDPQGCGPSTPGHCDGQTHAAPDI